MRRLDRYIFAEILGPLTLGFFVYTLILMLRVLFRSAKLIILSGVEASKIGQLLLLSMPWIVVMTIPMSLLFGILIAVGRLSADSELVAIRASGVSLFSLYRPILVLSALLTGLNMYLMLEVHPRGNLALQKLTVEILTESLNEEVQPRTPHTGWENRMLYVFESIPGEGLWRGVFFSDAIPQHENDVVIAESGEAISDDSSGEVVLSLRNAYQHSVDLEDPASYSVAFNGAVRHRLTTISAQQHATSVKRHLRTMNLKELHATTADPDTSPDHLNLAWVEIHKKFSIPAACLVFGLLALPLGFSNSRGGRSSGFAISLGVILVYWVLLNWGEEAARVGNLPIWLAMWLPNFVLLAAGLFLLARRNRDKSLIVSRVDSWIQEHLWSRVLRLRRRREERRERRRQALHAGRRRADLVLRLPAIRFTILTRIDRYVLGVFLKVLVIAALSGLLLYLVADLTEKIDNVVENGVPRALLLEYYQYKSFDILYEIAPIIVLVTTLISFGLLSRTNEIIACKALGISLYRLAVPVVLAAALVSVVAGFLQSEVLAASNERVATLEATIMGRTQEPAQRADRRWLYGKERMLYNYAHFDPTERRLHRLQVFKFDERYRLIGRLYVRLATYAEDGWWTFSSGWTATFDGTEMTANATFDQQRKYRLPDPPELFHGGLRQPEQMDYGQLRSYIGELQSAGQDVPNLEVALYNKVAYPVIALVMALVALPFAFRLGRHGALYGVGLSLVLGVVLLLFLGVFQAIGEAGILPPIVAVWSPNVIFSILSLYLFLGVRT